MDTVQTFPDFDSFNAALVALPPGRRLVGVTLTGPIAEGMEQLWDAEVDARIDRARDAAAGF
jgi:hypothetical protein